ncbi:MAG: BON domain-containing protein, partial [Chitinivibrionales bacterium]|nr:BON domain-containing protein [Chitinivibrionales bacterium]MBD3396513.1 BON domain-containing protein [Chitinivibrionales bacterium]
MPARSAFRGRAGTRKEVSMSIFTSNANRTVSSLTLSIFILIAAPILQGAAFAKKTKSRIPDITITRAVKGELASDQAVSAHLIDVRTNDGIVELSGSIDNLLARDRAVKLAQAIRGVRAVVNRIEVYPVVRADSDIRVDIVTALAEDPATDSYEIRVDVEDGKAVLSGNVESWAEKQLCASVTKGILGVNELKNNIKVSFTPNRKDHEIKAEIERRLELDPHVTEGLLEVAVKDG